jgi:hypothetical protein
MVTRDGRWEEESNTVSLLLFFSFAGSLFQYLHAFASSVELVNRRAVGAMELGSTSSSAKSCVFVVHLHFSSYRHFRQKIDVFDRLRVSDVSSK